MDGGHARITVRRDRVCSGLRRWLMGEPTTRPRLRCSGNGNELRTILVGSGRLEVDGGGHGCLRQAGVEETAQAACSRERGAVGANGQSRRRQARVR